MLKIENLNQSTNFPIKKVETSKLSQMDFNNLKFGRDFSDHMFVANYKSGNWTSAEIMPYQPLSFSPAACVFHYGQAIFEGLKAHRTQDGRIILFRPYENWKRMNQSARRMCMAEIPESIFINGLKELIKLDAAWVPEGEGKSLYIRPFLIANDEFLGVKPSEQYQFIIITSPASSYYSGAVSVKLELEYSRAASGGIGAAKAAGNYAASLLPAQKAQAEGYNQLIWTDSSEHKYIEESGTMNLMLKINDKLITPNLASKTILPGITRNSVIQLAKHWGIEIEERPIQVKELQEAFENNILQEAFGMGTAATIAPIERINIKGTDHYLPALDTWTFANRAKRYFEELKSGKIADEFNWLVEV